MLLIRLSSFTNDRATYLWNGQKGEDLMPQTGHEWWERSKIIQQTMAFAGHRLSSSSTVNIKQSKCKCIYLWRGGGSSHQKKCFSRSSHSHRLLCARVSSYTRRATLYCIVVLSSWNALFCFGMSHCECFWAKRRASACSRCEVSSQREMRKK